MRVTVTRHYTIDWDGTPADYIRLAHNLSEQGLDSFDMGDATGALVNYDPGNPEATMTYDSQVTGKTHKATVTFDDELFRYDTVEVGTTLTDLSINRPTQDEINQFVLNNLS